MYLQSPLHSRSPQSPLHSPLNSRSPQSPLHIPLHSVAHRVRSRACSSPKFHVVAWCSDPGTLVLFQAQFCFCVGVRTLTLQVWSCCGSMRSRVHSGRALLCPCAFVVFVLLSLVLFCFVLCGTQLVLFTGCVLSCLSCFV